MYVFLIVILVIIATIAIFSLLALSSYRRNRFVPEVNRYNSAINEYFRYLSAVTLGAASDESAREFCKAKSLWDIALTPSEHLAAFHMADGAARIILDDAMGKFDKDAYSELIHGYSIRKNNIAWAISRVLSKETDNPAYWDWNILNAETTEAKNNLFVRLYHHIKPYTRSWEQY